MTKRYTDELAEWVTKREKTRPRQDKGLVAFIAVKADIAEAIDAGYALKTIWAHLNDTGKIPYRYETFLKHVKKHIKNPKNHNSTKQGRGEQVAAEPATQEPRKLTSQPKEFEVNPVVNKEDLI